MHMYTKYSLLVYALRPIRPVLPQSRGGTVLHPKIPRRQRKLGFSAPPEGIILYYPLSLIVRQSFVFLYNRVTGYYVYNPSHTVRSVHLAFRIARFHTPPSFHNYKCFGPADTLYSLRAIQHHSHVLYFATIYCSFVSDFFLSRGRLPDLPLRSARLDPVIDFLIFYFLPLDLHFSPFFTLLPTRLNSSSVQFIVPLLSGYNTIYLISFIRRANMHCFLLSDSIFYYTKQPRRASGGGARPALVCTYRFK